MGTTKRERQKANRANKVEKQQKQLKRDLKKDRVLIFALCAIATVVAVALWVFFGDDSSVEDPATVTEEPLVPSQPLPTQPLPTEPPQTQPEASQ